jgi:hypothetical protein
MSKFLTDLDTRLKDDDSIWILYSPLIYESDLMGKIAVPMQFETDFASVPRLPLFYTLFGNRAHREAVIHDYLYRKDAVTSKYKFIVREKADAVFLEAMEVRGKSFFVRWPMYLGVRLAGWTAYHKHKVSDVL